VLVELVGVVVSVVDGEVELSVEVDVGASVADGVVVEESADVVVVLGSVVVVAGGEVVVSVEVELSVVA